LKGIDRIEVSGDNPFFSSIDGILFNKNMTELICAPSGIQLEDYIIPDTTRVIYKGAFQDCAEITGRIVIPDRIDTIDHNTFSGCGGLSEVKLPRASKKIYSNAFNECGSLTKITIPDGVNDIRASAFRNCSNLTKVIFLGDVPEKISGSAFKDCTPDLKLYYDPVKQGWSTPEWNGYPCFPMK
jgi:hypothetical protein